MFIWVAVVALIFESSQLLEGSLKFAFVCWYVHNTSNDGFQFFFTISSWKTFRTYVRPSNNQTVINRNEYYGKIIIPETQDNQIPTNNEQENCDETNDSFLFHVQGATNRNQNSV